MIKETIIRFTDEDFKLLKKSIPSSPCDDCRDSFICCGCPKETEYERTIKPYRDAEILEYAKTISEIRNLSYAIESYRKKIIELTGKLPDEIKPIINAK